MKKQKIKELKIQIHFWREISFNSDLKIRKLKNNFRINKQMLKFKRIN